MNKLSICMIIKNEYDNLSKNLPYLKEFIDKGIELVVVDTGSEDESVELCKKYTDKIFSFKWNDNFSEARNFSISKSSSDFILTLDADERPSFSYNDLQKLLNKIDDFDGAQLLIKNFLPNLSFNIDRQIRIFNKFKAQYQNKVHNQLIFKGKSKLLNTNFTIEHFGYADEKVLLEKRMRTIRLINDSLKEDTNNLYLIQQLARAYFAIKDYKNSFYYSDIVAQKIFAKEIKVKPNHLFYLESLIIAAKSLVELGRYKPVEKYYTTALKIFPNYIDALILSAEFYYHKGELKKAKEMLIKYLSLHDELLKSSFTIKLPPSNSFGMKLVALRFLILILKELDQIKEFKPFLELYLSLEKDPNRREDLKSLLL